LEELDILNANLQTKLREVGAQNQAYSAMKLDHEDLKEIQGDNHELRLQLDDLITQNEAYKKAQADYDTLIGKISTLYAENEDLKAQLSDVNSKLEEESHDNMDSLNVRSDMPPLEETKEEKAARAKAALVSAFGSKIPVATAADKDELKLINGVGPFIEKKLNGLGIYTFEQVSKFDDELSNQITDAIQFFPGRIQRDNWVGQAAELYGKKNEGALALGRSAKPKIKPNDLKIIEGIGPKIEGLLNAAGIKTWVQLADAPTDKLREILAAAGDRYRMHQPDTWPQQARLAADGKWDELEKLQVYLDGGKLPTDKK
jgi:predicted flap endonuclease-1-like 5' DNA nuclease